jgi:hypothetical protein
MERLAISLPATEEKNLPTGSSVDPTQEERMY